MIDMEQFYLNQGVMGGTIILVVCALGVVWREYLREKAGRAEDNRNTIDALHTMSDVMKDLKRTWQESIELRAKIRRARDDA